MINLKMNNIFEKNKKINVMTKLKSSILWAFLIILSFEVIYLAIQNRNLKSKIGNYQTLLNQTKFKFIERETFPDISLVNSKGEIENLLNINDRREIILHLFYLNCDSCIEMLKKLNKYNEESNFKYRIIGIANATTKEIQDFTYKYKEMIKIPIYGLKEKEKFEIAQLPLTLLLLPDGKILQSISGEFDNFSWIKELN